MMLFTRHHCNKYFIVHRRAEQSSALCPDFVKAPCSSDRTCLTLSSAKAGCRPEGSCAPRFAKVPA